MSLLDRTIPPPLPRNARLVHFGANGRVVFRKDESEFILARRKYLEKQKRASERQIARRAHQKVEKVVPFEEHLKSYFTLQLIGEE